MRCSFVYREVSKVCAIAATLMRRMARRSNLGWAGAGVLIAVAVASLAQAATLREATPVRAQPTTNSLTGSTGSVGRGRGSSQARPHASSTPPPALAEPPSSLVPPGRQTVHVPILMYHYIRNNPDPRDRVGYNLSVTPGDFARQMDWLAE